MQARDIMTANVVTVREDTTIEDAARLLARHRISGLPVVSLDGALIGLISELDLISRPGPLVSDVMSRSVISVTSETEVEQISDLLASRRIRRVPVVQDGKLVGIVSRSDLVRQIAMRWVCEICGHVERGSQPPEHCTSCGADRNAFTHDVVPPGM